MELIDAIAIVAAFGFIILFILLPRFGPHYTSRLVCPNCKKAFNFHWIPGATFTSLRFGNRRRLKCPYCSQVNTFDIASTRVSKPKVKRKA